MGKQSTFPILYDECKTVSVSKLRKWGYLAEGKLVSGTLRWQRYGEETGSISIAVYNDFNNRFVQMSYVYREHEKNYRIMLVSVPSNLGFGLVWYFVCPRTGKRCRKLYLVHGYFFHRSAFEGCYYEKQILSKKVRPQYNCFENEYKIESAYKSLYSKNFKTQYRGVPTKALLKLERDIRRAQSVLKNISSDDFL